MKSLSLFSQEFGVNYFWGGFDARICKGEYCAITIGQLKFGSVKLPTATLIDFRFSFFLHLQTFSWFVCVVPLQDNKCDPSASVWCGKRQISKIKGDSRRHLHRNTQENARLDRRETKIHFAFSLLFIQVNQIKFPLNLFDREKMYSSHVTLANDEIIRGPWRQLRRPATRPPPMKNVSTFPYSFFFFWNTFCRYFTLGGTVKEMLINWYSIWCLWVYLEMRTSEAQ